MKFGRKGFMLAEVVVVSVVLAAVLVTLFGGLNSISSAYDIRNHYYDIDCLYVAMEINDILIKNNSMDSFVNTGNVSLLSNNVSVKKFMEASNNITLRNMISKDIFATNVYTLGYEFEPLANLDYIHKVVEI